MALNSFFHIEGYSQKARRGEHAKPALAGVIAEATRRAGFCAHVATPLEPCVVYGMHPMAAADIAIEQANHARNAAGRKIRSIDVVMFAAVASYPVNTEKVLKRGAGGAVEIVDPIYVAWRKAALAWAIGEFSDALVSVIEHLDEAYPHLHIYVLPPVEGGRLRHERVHRGRAAQLGVADKKEQGRAYREAMSKLLDDYHASVGAPFGHERFGPRRSRTSRWWQLEKRRVEDEANRAVEAARLAAERSVIEIKKKLHDRLHALREDLRCGREAEAEPFAAERLELEQRVREAEARARRESERLTAAMEFIAAAGMSFDPAPDGRGPEAPARERDIRNLADLLLEQSVASMAEIAVFIP